MSNQIYSAAVNVKLRNFRFDHLPPHLQEISKPFRDLAVDIANRHPRGGDQLEIGLQKLLEAKDCVVRAATE